MGTVHQPRYDMIRRFVNLIVLLVGCMRWTPKTGPQVKMDFRRSAGEEKADYESKTQTA